TAPFIAIQQARCSGGGFEGLLEAVTLEERCAVNENQPTFTALCQHITAAHRTLCYVGSRRKLWLGSPILRSRLRRACRHHTVAESGNRLHLPTTITPDRDAAKLSPTDAGGKSRLPNSRVPS